MKKKKNSSQSDLQEVKQNLKQFDQLIKQTRQQIKEALTKGPAYEEELASQLDTSETALAGIRKKLSAAKAHVKKRKSEIDEWKLWYAGLLESDKPDGLTQLNEEIKWRADDIANKETEISALYVDLVQAEGKSEFIKIQIEGLVHIDFDGKVDDDIRIKTLLKEKEKLQKKMAQLK